MAIQLSVFGQSLRSIVVRLSETQFSLLVVVETINPQCSSRKGRSTSLLFYSLLVPLVFDVINVEPDYLEYRILNTPCIAGRTFTGQTLTSSDQSGGRIPNFVPAGPTSRSAADHASALDNNLL